MRLTAEPSHIKTRKGVLLAAELDAGLALSRWLGDRRETLRQIAERGTYLDAEDVDRILGLSLPGADELVALLELPRLARESEADQVVVDTAPTAHTLRLLQMPELLRRFAGVLDALEERHRVLGEAFGGEHRPDRADELIAELDKQGKDMFELLRDPGRAAFTWVLLPETLAIAETRDALKALDEAGIAVCEMIVNRVTPARAGACESCQTKRQAEAQAIAEIQEAFGDRALRFLPAFAKEPRGLPALRRMAKAQIAAVPSGREEAPSPAKRGREGEGVLPLAPPTLRLLLFGGKGGVGKTTCAAAAGLSLAQSGRNVLLLSTDPAHSLGDVLDTPLDDDERRVHGLRARELDAAAGFEAWRARHREELGEALESFAGESRAAVERLLDLTPPGLDELVALATILEASEENGAELIVIDTAPTGHALRLLESPELALEWDRALLSLLLKYREAVGLGPLAAQLVDLSKSLKRLLALLQDPDRARFVIVTRSGELPRRETVRLLEELDRLSIAVPAILLNAVKACGCPGEPTPADILKEVTRLRRACKGCAIMTASAVFPPPRGAGALAEWARIWTKA